MLLFGLEFLALGLVGGTGVAAANARKAFADGGGGGGYQPQYYPPQQQPQYSSQEAYGGYRAQEQHHSSGTVLSADRHGHFHGTITIDGVRAPGMIDSGASYVVLSHPFAAALGIDVRRLRYDRAINTANGLTYGKIFMLPQVSVEGITVENVEAMVLQGKLGTDSLIGASFLGRLGGVDIRGNQMILRP